MHLFAFGNFADSAQWIRDVASGRFDLVDRGDGIELAPNGERRG
jgi:hypothetical protein